MRTLARFHRQVQAFQRWGPERRGRPDRLDQDTVAIDSRHPAARQHFARDRNRGVEVLRCHQALRKRGGGAVGEWGGGSGIVAPAACAQQQGNHERGGLEMFHRTLQWRQSPETGVGVDSFKKAHKKLSERGGRVTWPVAAIDRAGAACRIP
jgi:hypothetical protein